MYTRRLRCQEGERGDGRAREREISRRARSLAGHCPAEQRKRYIERAAAIVRGYVLNAPPGREILPISKDTCIICVSIVCDMVAQSNDELAEKGTKKKLRVLCTRDWLHEPASSSIPPSRCLL